MADDEAKTEPLDSKRKSGGDRKSFPPGSLEESLTLAKGIAQHGVGDSMRRLTLFSKLGRSSESGPSRQLVTNSSRYGLTTGGYSAEIIQITEDGRLLLSADLSQRRRAELMFALGIQRFEPFSKLFERLKNKRVPAGDVLSDELGHVGIPPADRKTAGEVFLANLRSVGLVQELSGAERIISFEHLLEELGEPEESVAERPSDAPITPPTPNDSAATNRPTPAGPDAPEVHIDVQIHIDSSASPEQIDQVFASMAKHLYGRG